MSDAPKIPPLRQEYTPVEGQPGCFRPRYSTIEIYRSWFAWLDTGEYDKIFNAKAPKK